MAIAYIVLTPLITSIIIVNGRRYMYYTYVYIYIYMYIGRERERERERDIDTYICIYAHIHIHIYIYICIIIIIIIPISSNHYHYHYIHVYVAWYHLNTVERARVPLVWSSVTISCFSCEQHQQLSFGSGSRCNDFLGKSGPRLLYTML